MSKSLSITLLVLAEVAGMGVWFSSAAVVSDMSRDATVSPFAQAMLTSGVQAGFACGAIVYAMLGLADRFDPRRVFALSAIAAAAANAVLLLAPVGGAIAIFSRLATGAFLAGVYPVGSVTAAATGVNRITRHPFQWAVILWAASHLAANGDTVSVVFFVTFVLLSGIGSISLDAKKQAALGEAFTPFTALTSNLPFGAILAGRNKLVLGELMLPLLAGIALYLAFYFGHEWLSGVGIY